MPAISQIQLYGQIQKVDEQDDGTIMVHGIASTEQVDSAGEVVLAAAMREALPEYKRFPTIREMHQLSAAGSAVEVEVGDDNVTRIVAHIVDNAAINKVRKNVYRGFSIGGKVTKRNPDNRKIIEGLSLSEISLVDRPANPGSILEMWKADGFPPMSDASDATEAGGDAPHSREEDMTKRKDDADKVADAAVEATTADTSTEAVEKSETAAPINPKKLVDVLNDAQAAMDAAVGTAPAGKHVDVTLTGGSTAEAVKVPNPEEAGQATPKPIDATDTPAVQGASAKADDADAISQDADAEVTQKTEEEDPIAVARAAADAALKAATAVLSRLAKQAEGISPVLASGAELRKGLSTVSTLGYLLSELAYVLASAKYEQEYEGDNSPVPEKLHASLQSLAAAYKAMSDEELQELLDAADKTMGGQIALAAAGGDLGKALDGVADADAIAKVAAPAGADDSLAKTESRISILEGEREDLMKTVGGLTQTLGTLTKRVEEFAEMPMPPKTIMKAADPAIIPVSKEQDAAGTPRDEVAKAASTGTMSEEDVRKALESMPDDQRSDLLMRAALNPANARFIKR